MQRIIAHIDMNSYFASCEQQDNPAWRGRPLGVCEHLGGIIIAPSVEAKRYGVKTAMPVWDAKKLCPQIILTKTNPDRYRHYTAKFIKVFEDYTDKVEKYSIDEAFLDFTKFCNIRGANDPFEEAVKIAMEIKWRLKTEVGDWLRCSVGIGYSKLLAKIASDMKKPDGLIVVRPEDKDSLYDKLSLIDIPGIGSRQERNLQALGIRSLRDLKNTSFQFLVSHFGVMGHHLYSMGQLQGSWHEEFGPGSSEIKSMGHTYSIPPQFRHISSLEPVLYKLSEMVAVRLREQNLHGFVIHAHAGSTSRMFVSGSRKLSAPLVDGREIFLAARTVLLQQDKNLLSWPGVGRVGVTMAGLKRKANQPSLFGTVERSERLAVAMDKINMKYEGTRPPSVTGQTSKLGDAHEGLGGGFTIGRLPTLLAEGIIRDSVGFGRMKEFDYQVWVARTKHRNNPDT